MYAGTPYAGGAYAGAGMVAADIPADVEPTFSVEVSFTTDALADPAWVDVSADVRRWDTTRGRSRELERHQPARATVVLDNAAGAYDSQNTTGPWFGNLRPMRRIRIRETFSGVTFPRFDGYVDAWQLDYPGHVDSTVTVTATDGTKVLARTDLPRSVYAQEVEADSPVLWLHLDERLTETVAKNAGTLGAGADGTYVKPAGLEQESLIVNDPGSSMLSTDTLNFADHGVKVDKASTFELNQYGSFAVELWYYSHMPAFGSTDIWELNTDAGGTNAVDGGLRTDSNTNQKFHFFVQNTAGTVAYGVMSSQDQEAGVLYHIVCKVGPSGAMSITINGVKSTTTSTLLGASAPPHAGGFPAGSFYVGLTSNEENPGGLLSEVAVYGTAVGVDPLSDERIAVHYTAGTAPWQGDLPGVRAGRVLDLAAWRADLRELDAGVTTFQSATTDGQSALEHLHKTAETEAGAFFLTRAGVARLIARAALAARVSQATFGDAAGEIGYRAVTFDDGDATIRNRATISRLNGVARTDTDAASIAEFGTFQYTLDGLLHNTEAHSVAYASWVVDNFGQPARRVTGLELGPAAAGAEAALYTQILGRELGDMVTVKVRPPGGGTAFTQNVAIEAIDDRWDPQGSRTARWTLGPIPGTF